MPEKIPQIIPESKEGSFVPKELEPVNRDDIKSGDIIYMKRSTILHLDSSMGNIRGFGDKFCPYKVEEEGGKMFLVVLREGTPSFPPGHGSKNLEVGTRFLLDDMDVKDLYKITRLTERP